MMGTRREQKAEQPKSVHSQNNKSTRAPVMAQDPREHTLSAAKRSDHKTGLAEGDRDANTEHPVLCCGAESGGTELSHQKNSAWEEQKPKPSLAGERRLLL